LAPWAITPATWAASSSIIMRVLSGNVLRTGIERHDWRFAAIPSRQYALEPAGDEIFHDIDLGLQHDSEAGQRPVVEGVAIVDTQPRDRRQAGIYALRPPNAPRLRRGPVAQELMPCQIRSRAGPRGRDSWARRPGCDDCRPACASLPYCRRARRSGSRHRGFADDVDHPVIQLVIETFGGTSARRPHHPAGSGSTRHDRHRLPRLKVDLLRR